MAKMDIGRRGFIQSAAWTSVALMAGECLGGRLKVVGPNGAPMQGFALKPMKKVRVACIGVGSRGTSALRRLSQVPGTVVTAVADLFQDRIDKELAWLKKNGKPAPVLTVAGPEGYKRICESDAVDVIYNVTPWHMHAPIALYAMEHGKVALNEVPGALTIDECWQLVETSERTRIPCMMLENCCYGEDEMLMLNMVKQGVFGDIVHGEAGYIHDQRALQYGSRYHSLAGDPDASKAGRPGWALDFYSKHSGNWYPTHGLGPVAKYMDINRGDNFDQMAIQLKLKKNESVERALKRLKKILDKEGIIKTKLGRSILLEHDVSSPRPYSRLNLISGTKGMAMSYPELKVAFEEKTGDGKAHAYRDAEATEAIRRKYRHPFWQVAGEIAKKAGGHGGMDYIMDLRWSYCLQNGLPLDTDVYDLAAWSAMVELTERSVDSNSRPVDCPDFTRGAWRTAKGFTIDVIDPAKLADGFKDVKRDQHIDATARQEGLL